MQGTLAKPSELGHSERRLEQRGGFDYFPVCSPTLAEKLGSDGKGAQLNQNIAYD